VRADLLLVDTFERFGRNDETDALRRELHNNNGILILTADTGFSDPTTPQGEIFSLMEGFRARDDNRVKAHNVLRGKRDTVRKKHWPGGPIPRGLKLERYYKTERGLQVRDYSLVVHDPETGWIMKALFGRAHETLERGLRLARWFNDNPEIPDYLKPVSEHTVEGWLGNELFKGVMVFCAVSTGVVNDRRVLQRNSEESILRVEGFCEPLIEPAVWNAINSVKVARSETREAAAAAQSDGKLIVPLQGGIAIKNVLSGLVRCGCCGLSMVPSTSPLYESKKTGESKRYVNYKCPRAGSGGCTNTTTVPEGWLRETVLRALTARLFPRSHS